MQGRRAEVGARHLLARRDDHAPVSVVDGDVEDVVDLLRPLRWPAARRHASTRHEHMSVHKEVEKAEAGTRQGEGRAARTGREGVTPSLESTRTERIRTKSASRRAPSRAQASRGIWYSRELELSRTGGRKGCQGCACSACVSPFARREARRRVAQRTRTHAARRRRRGQAHGLRRRGGCAPNE